MCTVREGVPSHSKSFYSSCKYFCGLLIIGIYFCWLKLKWEGKVILGVMIFIMMIFLVRILIGERDDQKDSNRWPKKYSWYLPADKAQLSKVWWKLSVVSRLLSIHWLWYQFEATMALPPYGGLIAIDKLSLDNYIKLFNFVRLFAVFHNASGFMAWNSHKGPG